MTYTAKQCPCGHRSCSDWHVDPVAVMQGTKFTESQARAVATLLNSMEEKARGKGRTTAQMTNAPQRALFIWCNEDLHYPRALAHHLGRTDLVIIAPSALEDFDALAGRQYTRVILDHATQLSTHQGDNWGRAIANARPDRGA